MVPDPTVREIAENVAADERRDLRATIDDAAQ
jgi:hypothetical protein